MLLPSSRTSHARAPILHHNPIAPDQPHGLHSPAVPRREPSAATWPLKSSAGISQRVRFSDSHFFMQKRLLFHWLPLRSGVTIPLCHVHSFFEVLAYCSHFLKASGIPPSDFVSFWTAVEPVLFLCLPPCDRLGTYFHPTVEEPFLHPASFQK